MFPILIVDDSREDRELAERAFRQCKYVNPIHLLGTGAACVDFLRAYYDPKAVAKPDPCFILIDLAMPEMTGVQTIAAINEMVFAPNPWIIMLSGQTDVKQVRDGYQLGAKTFLTKPLRSEDIFHLIKTNQNSIESKITAQGYELHWAS